MALTVLLLTSGTVVPFLLGLVCIPFRNVSISFPVSGTHSVPAFNHLGLHYLQLLLGLIQHSFFIAVMFQRTEDRLVER